MKFPCQLSQRTDGRWTLRHAGPEAGAVEVTAATPAEAEVKMVGELRYRLELCPCTGRATSTWRSRSSKPRGKRRWGRYSCVEAGLACGPLAPAQRLSLTSGNAKKTRSRVSRDFDWIWTSFNQRESVASAILRHSATSFCDMPTRSMPSRIAWGRSRATARRNCTNMSRTEKWRISFLSAASHCRGMPYPWISAAVWILMRRTSKTAARYSKSSSRCHHSAVFALDFSLSQRGQAPAA